LGEYPRFFTASTVGGLTVVFYLDPCNEKRAATYPIPPLFHTITILYSILAISVNGVVNAKTVLLAMKKNPPRKKKFVESPLQGVYQDNEATTAVYAHAIILDPGERERFMKSDRRT
jgi:hypothetical protein